MQVTATADAAPGAYQINMTKDPNVQEKTLFSIVNPEGGRSITKTADDAILNPGTVVVIPEGVNLPTVILTDDTFAVPTWEEMKADKDEFALASRLKIIGGDKKLYDVDPASLDVSATENLPDGVYLNDGKTLELATRAEANTTGISLTVKSAKAVGADISISAPATVTAKISKATPYHLYTGFGKSGGYVPAPTTTQEVTAAEYSDSKAFRPISLNAGYPAAFDQFGKEMDSPKVKLEVMLFSDEECRNPLSPTDDAYQQVTVTENQTGVQVSNQLKKDVWCMVKTYVEAESTGAKTYGEQAKVHIISQYPQAEKAVIKLTDENNKPFSGNMEKGTFDIPGGSGETTIKFAVDKFLDKKNNEEMKGEAVPTNYTVAATQTSPATPADDVTISIDSDGKTGTITVGSGAAKSAPVEIEIKVTLADNTELTGILKVGTEELPAKITLKKGNPFATSLASYDSNSYAKGEIRADSYEGNALPTVLPGIGGDEASVVLAPLYVLDQYDAVMQTVAAANYKLYKVDGETKTPISADYAKFENGTEDRVTLKLTNALAGEEGAKSLALTAGDYQIEATYNNKTAIANFTMTEGETKLSGTPIYYDVETGNEPTLYVPYTYGTLDSKKATTMQVGAAIKTQYGRPYGSSETPAYALNNVELNGEAIQNNAVTWTAEADGTGVTFTVDKSAAQLFGTSNTATLTAEMTVTVGEKSTPSIPISITIKKEASELSAVKVEMAEDTAFTTGLRTWSANRTSESKEGEVTLLSPNAKKTWYIRRTAEDQYGVEMDIQSLVTATGCSWSYDTDKATGKILYFKLGVPAGYEDSFILKLPNKKPEYKFTAKFVPMQFVKSETGKNDTFQLSDYLNRTANEDDTFSAEYNGQPWSTILTTKPNAKVYIKTAEGEQNTPIDNNKLSLEVTKDGTPVGMDAKANAGSYQVKLVYTDAEGQTYTVDEKTFTITPKTVTITANGTITKEYDGTANLPDATLAVTAYETLNVDKSVLKFAQENVGTDINVELTSAGTNCLKTASGEPATNYIADLSELKGTITPRKLIVTPKAKTFEYGENDKITNALTTEFDYAGKNGDLPSGLTPTITGSMKLTTTSGADVTVYNAGTYKVVNNNLSAGTNYEIEFPAKPVQWTISRKLLTKVKNSGLPSSGFGANTDEGCISHLLTMSATDKDGMPMGILAVSDFVDASALSFPSNTVYVRGQNGTKYPAPKTYTLTVTNKPTKDIGKNYRVDETTVYEFDYTVNKLDASLLTVTLTEDTYTYNGMEQGPTVSVTYTNRANDTLDLTSRCTIGGTTKATDAGTYTITVTSDLLSVSKTVTWKINPKNIDGEDIEVVQQALHYTGEYVDLCDAVVKLRDKTLGADLVKGVDWDFVGACGTTNAGESQTVRIYGKGNYGIPNNHRAFTVTLQKAGAALDETQLEGKQATRNKTNVIELSPKYKLAGNPTIEVVGSSEWLDNNSVSAEYKDGKIKITLNVKDGPVTETSKVKLKLTIAGTNNYAETVKAFDVKIIEKLVQNFTIAPVTGDRAYSYSEGSVQMVATNAVGTVHWQIATDTSGGTAKIDSNGKLELGHPGTVKVVATANETDAYAAASQTYVLTITKGQVMITASSATMTANDPLPGFSATASGLNPNDSISEVFQTLTASAGTDGKTAGTFRVMPNATFKTGVKDWNEYYELSFVQGTLTVNPAVSVIDTVLPTIIAGNGCANGYANCACESFYDLDASRWYHEAIDWAYSLGLMNGTTKSTFGPNAAATRAQTWTMLARIAGQDTRRSSTWYEVGQKWAMNLGITDGTNPMGSLTREQLAAMLYRYVGSPAVNGTLTFTDSANVSAWARNAMIWAVQNGILDGVGGNRLNPKGTTTRAQAAAIFMRFSKLINK